MIGVGCNVIERGGEWSRRLGLSSSSSLEKYGALEKYSALFSLLEEMVYSPSDELDVSGFCKIFALFNCLYVSVSVV